MDEDQINSQEIEAGVSVNPEPQAPLETQDSKKSFFKKYRWPGIIAAAVLVLAGVGGWYFTSIQNAAHPVWVDEPVGLVASKVSQSAGIAVYLPDGVSLTPKQAKTAFAFNPEIKGDWQQGPSAQRLIFKPSQQLTLNQSYRITLATANIKLQKDFTADEDPKVLAMFPNDGSEADETSDVTITFNRPMVPLTTLDVLDSEKIPVTIIPATEGHFKWISTRTLKFIPKDRLHRSTHYSIKLNDGLLSVDGLPAAGAESHFTTRPLRYQSGQLYHGGVTLYNEPITLNFNQPVDLEKTKNKISVTTDNNPAKLNIIVEYGTRAVYLGDSSGKTTQYIDKSVLNVYQAKDKNGRERFWDNNTNYALHISGAVPLEGDINLEEARDLTFEVPDVISAVTATSSRSNLAEASLFDPQGKLVVDFYEAVDKDKTQIKAPGLKTIEYGQQCKTGDDGQDVMVGPNCEKEPNKKELFLTFDEKTLSLGQNFDVEFVKVMNADGLTLNAQSLHQSVTVYPKLQILSSSPANGGTNADVTLLTICTNSPLQDADVGTFYQWVKSNYGLGKWNWDPAYKVQPNPSPSEKCGVGQYANNIHYGLKPMADYDINLHLTDHFGQTSETELKFSSGQIANIYKSFTNLQKAYNVTSPAQTKLTYAVENLDYVNLNICKMTAEAALAYLNGTTQPAATTPGESLNCEQSWNQKISLQQKYWDLNYFQVDLKDYLPDPYLGFYVLSFSNPDLREQNYDYQTNQTVPGKPDYERTFVNITNLAAQGKKVEVEAPDASAERAVERKLLNDSQGNLYWVSDIGRLNPVAGAQVQVYQNNGKVFQSFDASATDNNGIARTKPYNGDGAAVVTLGNDQTIVSSAMDKFQWGSSDIGGEKTYIYSDRPIYRPGQEVDIKGLYRIGYDASYQVFTGKQAHLQIFDSKNNAVLTQDLPISNMGTFNTVFNLGNGAPLGSYRVEALGGVYSFDVEDYVPAAFKLVANPDKPEYIAGDDFKVNVDANYYFDVPVDSGQIEYSVVAQDYYFDRYQDQYFQFGAGWYYSQDPNYGDNYILRGKTTLDSQGHAVITQNLDFSKLFSADQSSQSKVFVVNVTATNGLGQAVSGQTSFIVHRGEFYLGVNLQKDYFGKNEANKVLIKSVDTQGKEKSVGNIQATINRITWDYYKRQEVDGGYYYHSEKKTEAIKQWTISTDANGNASEDFTVDKEGEYEVTLKATDSRNNPITATQSFYVYGDATVNVEPLNNESLDLAVQNNQVDVGQNVNIVIKSPFPKAKALVAVERGRILDYQVVDVTGSFYNYSLTVKDSYLPNFYVTVLLLSPDPQVKFGQVEFYVNNKQKTLSVDVTPSKKNYLPGEEVSLDVVTKDSTGKPVPAEVSLSVADLSVLALVGNPKKDPVSFFYDGFPLSVSTDSNIKNILVETDIPTGTKGGGGADPSDLAKKKRGVFKDTAYWNATVQTDGNGHANVKFTLPDNLTTWQAEGVGITADTKLGVSYQEFTANKQLMAVPLVPRFAIPGDEFVIGAQIFNQTGSSQKLDVNFDSSTLTILDSKQTSVSIDSGKSAYVYFKVQAPVNKEDGQHAITLSAKNKDYEDTVEQSFPIKRNDTFEAVATDNYTTDQNAQEYVWLPKNIVPDKGGVSVTANATLAGYLPDALNYLVDYPYGCTEQMVSKITGVAAIKRLSKIDNLSQNLKLPQTVQFEDQQYSLDDVVGIGLSRILSNQTPEGGFAYYPNMKPDFYLTLDVLNALQDIKAGGYKVNQDAESRAIDYIYQTYTTKPNLYQSKDSLVLVAYTLSRSPFGDSNFTALKSKVAGLFNDSQYINENISNLSLNYLALLAIAKFPQSFQDQVFKQLENRVLIDARGAYLASPAANDLWYYYETPIKDTALLLEALSLGKRDYISTDKLVRWLLASRFKDNSWGSTDSTVTALGAFMDYLDWKQETDSHFTLELLLDGKSQSKMEFGSSTVLGTLNSFMPVSDFSAGKLSQLTFNKQNQNNLPNGFYYGASLKYYLPVDNIAPRDEGFTVERELYALDDKAGTSPLKNAKVGQVLRGHLTVIVGKPRNFVAIESPIPAGMELINFSLATSDQTLQDSQNPSTGSGSDGNPNPNNAYIDSAPNVPPVVEKPLQLAKPGFWSRVGLWFTGWFKHGASTSKQASAVGEMPDSAYSGKVDSAQTLYPDSQELHDDRIMLFSQQLQPGVYEYDYFVRALIPGKFQHLPATASELYIPENFGRTRGETFEITK